MRSLRSSDPSYKFLKAAASGTLSSVIIVGLLLAEVTSKNVDEVVHIARDLAEIPRNSNSLGMYRNPASTNRSGVVLMRIPYAAVIMKVRLKVFPKYLGLNYLITHQ
ncbi:hypothetical protein KIN20_023729 [Parelaphostrongylus tenuis]|uniref:Uncharacterized protein n=1 Tax=Parelaphostrongylus tenuis TaxID=148309 RepID=A0AAD5QXG7_PARTN|nr:hypothetical protein KIN20_023729 [Parelaphostrongylus tenuis]